MQNKSMISKLVELLHLLSVPDNHFDSINSLAHYLKKSKEEGYNMLMIVTNQLGSTDICLISCHTTNTAPEIAHLFFDK